MKDHDARVAYWQRTELSPRAQNCLSNEGIDDVEALLNYPDYKLINIPNVGKVTFREIKQWLAKLIPGFTIPGRAVELASDEALLVELHRRLKASRAAVHD